MNRFTLKFSNKTIETEYSVLKSCTTTENIKLTFFFLILFEVSVGIPAIIDGNLLGFLITLGVIGLLLLISCLTDRFRRYRQFLAFIVIFVFYFARSYFVPGDINNNSKEVFLLRGYAIGGIAIPLMARFPGLQQKLMGTVVAFGLRFLIIGLMDTSIFEPDLFVRYIFIDCFMAYVFYSNEKTERKLFLNSWESREKFKKFKELVENYLPQSIIVFNPWKDTCLFSNKSSYNVFKKSSDPTSQALAGSLVSLPQRANLKDEIRCLEIDKTTANVLSSAQSSVPSFYQISNDSLLLKDLIDEFAANPMMDTQALSVSASRLIEGNKQIFGVVLTKIKWDEENAVAIVLNDLTDHENLLALKMVNENKDKTLATVAHELRTPLNGIIGILGMAESRVADLQVLEYLDLCKDNAHLLLGLVNSILDLQQIKQGKLRLNVTKVHIEKIVRDIIRLFHFQCEKKGITLKVSIGNDIPTFIATDENRLKQILINLVGNAIKFTFKGGITIGVAPKSTDTDYLDIWVSDTGIGIKDEDKVKLFKMYGKLKDGESVNKTGVGLGLMISNALAQLLSGRMDDEGIQVDSKYGEGTKFGFAISKSLETEMSPQLIIKSKNEVKEHYSGDDSFSHHDISSEFPQGFTFHTKITQSHSNSVLLKGLSPKRGSHFLLPTEKTELLIQKNRRKRTAGTILVVDDNPFNLMVARNSIDKLGYTCETALNASEAIEKVKANASTLDSYKVILMDQHMPIVDGITATKVLRGLMEKGEVSKIPIVALTASNDEGSIKECYECGMSDHLQKPLRSDNLVGLLSKLK